MIGRAFIGNTDVFRKSCGLTPHDQPYGSPDPGRSFYVCIEHPTPEREAEIIASRTRRSMRGFTARWWDCSFFRELLTRKAALILEMIDFVNALQLLATNQANSKVP